MNKLLTIDPSGTGTTGLLLVNTSLDTLEFTEYQSEQWQEHFNFLVTYLQKHQPSQIVYENSNFISKETADAIALFKLLGAIETLTHLCPFIKNLDFLDVTQVKRYYQDVLNGKRTIEHLSYQEGRGKGWLLHDQYLSSHELDAFLLYHIYTTHGKFINEQSKRRALKKKKQDEQNNF